MATFGIDMTDSSPIVGWEAIQPEPMTPAEIALADARVELAEAWKEVDYWDDRILEGHPDQLSRTAAHFRALAAQIKHDLAWDALNADKASAIANSINHEEAVIENTP